MSEIEYIINSVYRSYLTSNKTIFDIYFELHLHIEEYVCNNSFGENIIIINKYSGDVFTALKQYNYYYNDIDIYSIDKEKFYSKLAYYSIRYNTDIYERMKDYINDDNI